MPLFVISYYLQDLHIWPVCHDICKAPHFLPVNPGEIIIVFLNSFQLLLATKVLAYTLMILILCTHVVYVLDRCLQTWHPGHSLPLSFS